LKRTQGIRKEPSFTVTRAADEVGEPLLLWYGENGEKARITYALSSIREKTKNISSEPGKVLRDSRDTLVTHVK